MERISADLGLWRPGTALRNSTIAMAARNVGHLWPPTISGLEDQTRALPNGRGTSEPSDPRSPIPTASGVFVFRSAPNTNDDVHAQSTSRARGSRAVPTRLVAVFGFC